MCSACSGFLSLKQQIRDLERELIEMGRKVMMAGLVVVVAAAALMLGGEGARMMKEKEEEERYRPQNFIVGGGFIPTTPGTPGFATGFGFGPSGFCSFPGSCNNNVPATVLPTIPGGGGGGVGSPP